MRALIASAASLRCCSTLCSPSIGPVPWPRWAPMLERLTTRPILLVTIAVAALAPSRFWNPLRSSVVGGVGVTQNRASVPEVARFTYSMSWRSPSLTRAPRSSNFLTFRRSRVSRFTCTPFMFSRYDETLLPTWPVGAVTAMIIQASPFDAAAPGAGNRRCRSRVDFSKVVYFLSKPPAPRMFQPTLRCASGSGRHAEGSAVFFIHLQSLYQVNISQKWSSLSGETSHERTTCTAPRGRDGAGPPTLFSWVRGTEGTSSPGMETWVIVPRFAHRKGRYRCREDGGKARALPECHAHLEPFRFGYPG